MQTRLALTLDDYIRKYDSDGPFELVDGEVIPLSPPVAGHVAIAQRINFALYEQAQKRGLGETATDAPLVLTYDSDWVPDVSFYTRERLEAYRANDPAWDDKPYTLVPDIAVEIIPANDRYTDVTSKVDGYLADGVRLVWVIDPRRRTVTVREGSRIETLTEGDALGGGDVVAEFSLLVKLIFEN